MFSIIPRGKYFASQRARVVHAGKFLQNHHQAGSLLMKNDDGESFSNATRGPPKELIESEAKLSLSLSLFLIHTRCEEGVEIDSTH